MQHTLHIIKRTKLLKLHTRYKTNFLCLDCKSNMLYQPLTVSMYSSSWGRFGRFSLAMTSRQLPGTPPVEADRASLEWDGLCSPNSPGHPGKDMSLNSVNQTPNTSKNCWQQWNYKLLRSVGAKYVWKSRILMKDKKYLCMMSLQTYLYSLNFIGPVLGFFESIFQCADIGQECWDTFSFIDDRL